MTPPACNNTNVNNPPQGTQPDPNNKFEDILKLPGHHEDDHDAY